MLHSMLYARHRSGVPSVPDEQRAARAARAFNNGVCEGAYRVCALVSVTGAFGRTVGYCVVRKSDSRVVWPGGNAACE